MADAEVGPAGGDPLAGGDGRAGVDPGRGVYAISVAAELVGMDPQSLRLYERRGLLDPERTPGGTRRYSAHNLRRLERIGELLTAGLNLAGIAVVLELEADVLRLEADVLRLEAALARLQARRRE